MALVTTLDSTTRRRAMLPMTFSGVKRSIADQRAAGAADRAVSVGNLIALPILQTIGGRPVDLIEIAADRSVVLVFHRGDRCPSGAATLRAYAGALPRIEAAGGTLIAVMADRPGRALETVRSDDPRFAVVIDGGNRFAQSLDLAAPWPDGVHRPCGEAGTDPSVAQREESRELPIPATYVLAPCGRVTWAHVDPDATRRADPDDVAAAVERLAAVPADRHQTTGAHAWESLL